MRKRWPGEESTEFLALGFSVPLVLGVLLVEEVESSWVDMAVDQRK